MNTRHASCRRCRRRHRDGRLRGRLWQGRRRQKSDSSSSSSGGTKPIGLLLPDNVTARYEKFDKPYFEAKVKELCSDCNVESYANAAAGPDQAGPAGRAA